MRLRSVLLSGLLLLCLTGYSQEAERLKKLSQQKQLCEKIVARSTGKSETFDTLITVGKAALKLTKTKDYAYKMAFNQAVGVGYYYKQDFKNTRYYFEQAYAAGMQGGLVELSIKPLGNLISVYHYLGLQKEADQAAQKLKAIAENTDTLKNKGFVYYNLGMYNQQQKFYYSIALENFLKSAELQKLAADTTKIIKVKLDYTIVLMMIAEVYIYLKEPQKALQYLDEVRPNLGLSIIIDVGAYGKFIRSYGLLNDRANALKYYNLLHTTVGKKPGRWSELVSSSIEMANLALRANDLPQAKSYIDKANTQANLDKNELLTSPVNMLYGDYYKRIKRDAEALKYYKLAEHGAMFYNKEQYSELLSALTAIEIKMGNNVAAAAYFDKYVTVSDSLNQRKISLNLAEMEARFQNSLKQKEIKVLNTENNNKQLQLADEKRTRWFLAGAILFIFLVAASIYRNYRNKQKANLLLDKKNQELDVLNNQLSVANETKAKLFSIISHDLRSPISQLFTFLKLQQVNPTLINETDKQKHQENLMRSSANLLETLEDLLIWSKSQLEHFEPELSDVDVTALLNDVKVIMDSQAHNKNIIIKIGAINCPVIHTDYNLLLIILRNILQNAINHAYAESEVVINADYNTLNKPCISIINQGDVMDSKKITDLLTNVNVNSKTSGYGLVIVKELLQKINGDLTISSGEETVMRVSFAN